eukprot:CAMPEP_0171188296 /NCGR_PEP_ID=MMETSP0790-20130122/17758_1 /TAXON_ID=2925 /ORGANISM="Alexandrium catenella, Strain OF101" /LENGTH=232 /DNA_ID=CAMNT_0011653373 /DNA_START=75 /DNA_END=773 /DNA_ORIENTATION=+
MVRILGLTGPIASGKSAVTSCLVADGCPVVDADKIAHELLAEKGGQTHRRVVAALGPSVLDESGTIDRKKIGELVFNDRTKMLALNRATHLPIIKRIVWLTVVLILQGQRRIALDIPLLLKFPLLRRLCVSAVLVVTVPPNVQLARLMARNGLSEEEAQRKIAAQLPAEVQRQMADFAIDNGGTLEELQHRVAGFLAEQPRGWSIYEIGALAGATASLTGACIWAPPALGLA